MSPSRLYIRASQNTLVFAVADHNADHQVAYEPYIVRSGISLAANLREAFRRSPLLNRGYLRAALVVDAPVLLIPLQEFSEDNVDTLYRHTFPQHVAPLTHTTTPVATQVLTEVLPNLNAVAAYAVNSDLRLVVEDHFTDVRFSHVMTPVWAHMHNRNYTGQHRKLYTYMHDKKIEVFSFDQNRFRFSNTFEFTSVNDCVYHLLHVWKTLGMDNANDELYIAYAKQQPDYADQQQNRLTMLDTLRRYLTKVYNVNPSADFNRAPVTQVKGITFDLMILLRNS